MDTSKEYIKMCDCEEIQNEWTRQAGDFYSINREDVSVYFGMDDSYMMWLPRQDQLQEMIKLDTYEWIKKCWSEVQTEPLPLSMEKLMLEIVMWEKHSAMWTGSEWDRAQWTKEELEEIKKDPRPPIKLDTLG